MSSSRIIIGSGEAVVSDRGLVRRALLAVGIFALMVGGQLFGLVGMVLAVPAAASIRVVLIQLFPRMGEPLPGFRAPGKKKTIEASAAEPAPSEAPE